MGAFFFIYFKENAEDRILTCGPVNLIWQAKQYL